MRTRVFLVAAVLGGCESAQQSSADQAPPVVPALAPAAPPTAVSAPAVPDSIARPHQPTVPTPKVVRGLYVNRWAVRGQRMWDLIDVAKRTEVNALVIDVKDDRGFVLYRSTVPLAREIFADTTMPVSYRRIRAVLDTMRAHGIYPIARIVVAKDPLLAERRPDWAIKRRADPASPWLDKNGKPWLDPHQRGIWQYSVDLAKEAVDLGFSEVQLDYVRFPDEKGLVQEAAFPLANGRTRAQVIREQLAFTRAALRDTRVPMTIDVFGLTATDTTDMGIGQQWEMFVDQADAVLPMVYPSHFAPGTYGLRNPNASPYATIDRALEDAARRTAGIANAAALIPWYQDFTLGPPRYGVAEVRAQIRAGYDNGVMSWMLWNPGSRYTVAALAPAIDARDTLAAAVPAGTAPSESADGAARPRR
ncbi:MAG TPA: putative glycoside hydrolase [Gemmatimonadaceae bacterium]|nr:putative glycoside hydrolase [Gemmatimonadaceae bacterium]